MYYSVDSRVIMEALLRTGFLVPASTTIPLRRSVEDDITEPVDRRFLVRVTDANSYDHSSPLCCSQCKSYVFSYAQYSNVYTSSYYTGTVPIIGPVITVCLRRMPARLKAR